MFFPQFQSEFVFTTEDGTRSQEGGVDKEQLNLSEPIIGFPVGATLTNQELSCLNWNANVLGGSDNNFALPNKKFSNKDS